MKKGFTMIELVFVIVILGIVAGIAIISLASTKEDAEISATLANLRTLLSDASAYYVAKGHFTEAKWRDFTNVPLKDSNGTAIDATLKALDTKQVFLAVAGKNCLQVAIKDGITAYISFGPVAANKNDPVCGTLLTSDLAKPLLDSTLSPNPDDPARASCKGVSNGGMSCIEITPNSTY